MGDLDNINTFEKWVENINKDNRTITIPDYQRTYSWDIKNAKILFNDLQNNEEYFLGLFLLEEKEQEGNKKYALIDGQQRFTTLFMLLLVLQKSCPDEAIFSEGTLVKDFIYSESLNNTLRLALQEGQNRDFFKQICKGNYEDAKNIVIKYRSQKNIKDVICFFYEQIKQENFNKRVLLKIMKNLSESKILIHSAANTGSAMQIFELLNDRGKSLTQLEALKSFIMHRVYIEAGNNPQTVESSLDEVKKSFSEIYQCLNVIDGKSSRNFHEDDILRYHYIAFENWDSQNDHRNVKDNLKDIFYDIDTVKQLAEKTEAIKRSFELIKDIIEKVYSNAPDMSWLKNLYILDRMASS